MEILDKTEKNKHNTENVKYYNMPLKARIVMESVTGLTMALAPITFVVTLAITAWSALWGAFIDMPLEVRQRIMAEYIKSGVARRKVDLTES